MTSDEELAAAAAGGDRGAFDALMRRHERLVFRFLWSFAGGREEALDLTQIVFLKAWRALGSFRGEASFRSWLLRIAHHEGLNRVRGAGRRGTAVAVEEEGEAFAAPAGQEEELLERERRGRLRRALAGLHERYRQPIELRYFHRLPIREIAGVLGTSEAMTKNLLFRGLRHLRRAVEEAA
ncbi:MAG TPA: RNA polymerase sigma factor [Thermoanaerobaculia bacterium]|nr:RNA polymerase sigma factor [Thermoanaerobaculia bacterium]